MSWAGWILTAPGMKLLRTCAVAAVILAALTVQPTQAQFPLVVSEPGTGLSLTSRAAGLTELSLPCVVSLSVLGRSGFYVFFSTNVDAGSALDVTHYRINHGVIVTNAEFEPALGTNGPQSVVRLDVKPLMSFFPDYSLTIGSVLSAADLLPMTPNPTVLSFHLDYRDLGYIYLSPVPGAEYVSPQTRFVLVRFKGLPPGAVTNLFTFLTVVGASSGIHTGDTHVASDGRTVIFTLNRDFSTNELVTVRLEPQSAPSSGLEPYQYHFVVGGHLPDPGIITARGESPPYQAKEKAFDGDPATKWLDYIVPNGDTNFSWIQYVYPFGGTRIIGQYALTCADDAPERDPADWNFYGVDPSGSLVLLDTQTGQSFNSRLQRKVYSTTKFIACCGYRLEVTRVNHPTTAVGVQLAELEFLERQGSILREYWLNIPGTAVSDLTNNADYPASPSASDQLTSFETPSDWAENYGTRVRGYVTAPSSGTFFFWVASDDTSELSLSTNDDPANKRLIAFVPGWTSSREWGKYSQQKSEGINLTAGQKYYVEVLQKEACCGDNLAVGWAKPGQSTSSPSEVIPGTVLSPWTEDPLAPALAAASLKDTGLASRLSIMPNGVSVPGDFPQITLTARGNPSTDCIWLENVGQNGPWYKVILDTWGNPVFYQRGGATDFKPQKNGAITWGTFTEANPNLATFTAVDKNFNYIRSYSTVNGYGTDIHELRVMEDGSYYLIGGSAETVDMSRYVAGANPAARVTENAIQHFTAEGDLIFQWRAWDHVDILSQQEFIPLTAWSFDFPHMNSIDVDEDGHILLSSRSTSECTKIDRDTGEVIWRLGGTHSTLTFLNDPLNGPRNQHSFLSLGGGHYILFDNGDLHTPPVSRAVEYAVDPVAKTATLVWQFRDMPDKYAVHLGNVQRLPNGNTHINWAMGGYPKAVEVDSNGVKQLELALSPGNDLYRSWRAAWDGVVPVPYLIVEPYPDKVTLIFNKFGDTNVNSYRIYGGTSPQPTNLLATTPFTLAQLSNLQDNQQYYFRVTAVAGGGKESGYSNQETVMVNLVQPGQNMVQNGDFSAATNGWTFATNNTGAGTFNVVTGACLIAIANPGTALADLQLRQSGLKLIQSRQYVLEFDGQSIGGNHPIEVKLGQDQSPFGIYYLASPTLRTTPQHFTYSFTMTGATDLNTRLMFNMGGLARNIVLDNISLYMAHNSQVTVTLQTLPGGLTVSVDGTNYTAPVSLTWATNSSHTLTAPTVQFSPDAHARFRFLSWSDGGGQTHTVTAPRWDTNYAANFSTEFLMDITLAPAGGGNVTSVPSGPWYPPNQMVALTAQPGAGFNFTSWGGVDTQSNNTAQVTMGAYRNVTAAFQAIGSVSIDTLSIGILPDGSVQFGVTAPGAATATVLGSTNLLTWEVLQTLVVTNGRAVFTDRAATNFPNRFYRARVP
jgi:hypothetical protein